MSIYDWFKFRIWARYHVIKTDLKPGYCEPDDRLLYGAMAMLVQYIEGNKPWMENELLAGRSIDVEIYENEYEKHMYKRQANGARQLVKVYKWWKNYQNRLKEIDDQDIRMASRQEIKGFYDAELSLLDESVEMLKILAENRGQMWT